MFGNLKPVRNQYYNYDPSSVINIAPLFVLFATSLQPLFINKPVSPDRGNKHSFLPNNNIRLYCTYDPPLDWKGVSSTVFASYIPYTELMHGLYLVCLRLATLLDGTIT